MEKIILFSPPTLLFWNYFLQLAGGRLESNSTILNLLIGAEGARLLREYGAGETPQALALRRLPGTPAESEAAWSANQQTY